MSYTILSEARSLKLWTPVEAAAEHKELLFRINDGRTWVITRHWGSPLGRDPPRRHTIANDILILLKLGYKKLFALKQVWDLTGVAQQI